MSNLRVYRKDILLKELDRSDFRATGSVIIYTDNKTAPENKMRYYEVTGIGPACTEVKVGDKVIVSWLDTMPSFVTDEGKRTLTTEDKVCGILTQ